jgi:hypothetical protein
MATTSIFLLIWGNEKIRTRLLSKLDEEELCALRLTSSECCRLTTPILFKRTYFTFTPSTFTRPSRLEALSHIGHHIEHLTFSMPHTKETFLPPLLNSETGCEISFVYTPHSSLASQRPKYGTQELGNSLTQQYPPIFHAATNVPAFIRALSCLPNLRHLTITCPGLDPAQRYRRNAVDYALISLRIAVECAPLLKLSKLSLNSIHAAALLYLRSQPGFGTSPASSRRWKQIRKLKLTVEAWDFNGPTSGLDHLKIIDDYIRSFSANLEKVSFTWNGLSGPCPFTLPTYPAKLFGEVASPMGPLPAAPPRPDMHFSKLRYMQVRNCSMEAKQVSDLVYAHRHSVREYDLERVLLLNGGTWEEALDPLKRMSGSEAWRSTQTGSVLDGYKSSPDSGIDISEPRRDSILVKKRRLRRRRKVQRDPSADPTPSSPHLDISSPIMSSSTIFADQVPLSPLPILQPMTFQPSANIQGVQRNALLDSNYQLLAGDVDKRVFTLKNARDAVLTRLGSQFSKRNNSKEDLGNYSNRRAGGSRGNLGTERGTQLVPLMIFR